MSICWTRQLVLLLCLSSGSAWGQNPEGSAAKPSFEQQYSQATDLYKAGRYQESLGAFESAYKLNPKPGILFNMGQAHLKLGRPAQALEYYERYEQVKHPLEPLEQKKLDAARAEAHARLVAPPPEPPKPASLHLPPASPPQASAGPGPVPQPTGPKVGAPIYKRWWFWGAIGVVAAGTAAGIAAGVAASSSGADPFAGVPADRRWKPEF